MSELSRRGESAPAARRSDETTPDASVVVLAHRLTDGLDRCLQSLSAHRSNCSFEVIVVLNGATPDVVAVVDRHPEVTPVVSLSNRGFAGGCNLGAGWSQAEYVIFLNDDAVVMDCWLDSLVHLARTNREIGAVASLVLDEDEQILEFGGGLKALAPEALERGGHRSRAEAIGARFVHYVSGCSLLVDRALFADLGGFDESFYPAYFEDADLSLRIWQAGRSVAVTPSSAVLHRESSTSSTVVKEILFGDANERFLEKWRGRELLVPDDLPSPLPRIVYIDDFVPRASSGAGLARARENLDAICSLGVQVAILANEPNRFDLDPQLKVRGVAQIATADDLRGTPRPMAVVVSRPHNLRVGREVLEYWEDVPLVYDAEARFSARIEKQLCLPDFESRRASLESDLATYLELEEEAARTADVIVAISDDEASWFGARGEAKVYFVDPFPDRCEAGAAEFSERPDVVFIAGWLGGSDTPNGDAVRWLAREVVPRLAEHASTLSIKVTGSAPPKDLLELQSDRLRFIGEVSDLDGLLDSSRVVVAPIRYGSGVKLKVVNALARAVPVVTSTVGAEGIRQPWKQAMIIEDDPERFVQLLIELFTSQESWQRHRDVLLRSCANHRGNRAEAWAEVLETAANSRPGTCQEMREHA